MAETLLKHNAWSSIDHLNAIYWSLSSVLFYGRQGAVLEVGCNVGRTSVWIQQIIQDFAPGRELHLFDSFQGLPARGSQDTLLDEGQLAASEEEVAANFREWGLPAAHIHAGWFKDTLPVSCPAQVCFAYLDGDYYESILTSLEYVYPRLAPGGMILVDDYCDNRLNPRAWDGFPGVKAACDVYFTDADGDIEVLAGAGPMSVALIRKAISAR
jgi:O-methyltransferase